MIQDKVIIFRVTDPDALFAGTSAACVEFLFHVLWQMEWDGVSPHYALYRPH